MWLTLLHILHFINVLHVLVVTEPRLRVVFISAGEVERRLQGNPLLGEAVLVGGAGRGVQFQAKVVYQELAFLLVGTLDEVIGHDRL